MKLICHTPGVICYLQIEFLGAGTYLPLAAEVVRNKGLHLLDRLLRVSNEVVLYR